MRRCLDKALFDLVRVDISSWLLRRAHHSTPTPDAAGAAPGPAPPLPGCLPRSPKRPRAARPPPRTPCSAHPRGCATLRVAGRRPRPPPPRRLPFCSSQPSCSAPRRASRAPGHKRTAQTQATIAFAACAHVWVASQDAHRNASHLVGEKIATRGESARERHRRLNGIEARNGCNLHVTTYTNLSTEREERPKGCPQEPLSSEG